jgi:hypothetical protein
LFQKDFAFGASKKLFQRRRVPAGQYRVLPEAARLKE